MRNILIIPQIMVGLKYIMTSGLSARWVVNFLNLIEIWLMAFFTRSPNTYSSSKLYIINISNLYQFQSKNRDLKRLHVYFTLHCHVYKMRHNNVSYNGKGVHLCTTWVHVTVYEGHTMASSHLLSISATNHITPFYQYH